MKKIVTIIGARPQIIKAAAISRAINTHFSSEIQEVIVHTGQHYDKVMSDGFFEQLGIPTPDSNLGCGGGSQAEQTAAIMIKFEKELQTFPTDLVLVVGDVTSTMACTITAKKMGIKCYETPTGWKFFGN